LSSVKTLADKHRRAAYNDKQHVTGDMLLVVLTLITSSDFELQK